MAAAHEIGPARRIVAPGKNCWREEPAGRVAFLIDAAAYFSVLRKAILNARERVFIIGWDIDSRVRLDRSDPQDGAPVALRELLTHVVERRPALNIYVLLWDYTVVYMAGREFLPAAKLGDGTPLRVHFRFDNSLPVGAAHHQKIVVIDDKIAFVGGIDITENRWDTPEHSADDPMRVDHNGKSYGPFHDVQAMVDDNAAAAIGELARTRWRDATGEEVPVAVGDHDPWPADLAPDLRNVRVAIARTRPELDAREEIREIEALYVDSIAAAERHIYIENQYLTSETIADALAARLAAENGPEVVIVMPESCLTWAEDQTMGLGRAKFLSRLTEIDRCDRLRLYAPTVGDGGTVLVHAKLMVVDDKLVRIGSSNLNNRSMGFDSECDLAIETTGDRAAAQAIVGFRNRLLAEHLGATEQQVAESLVNTGSIIRTIDRLGKPGRSLMRLTGAHIAPEDVSEPTRAAAALGDPERPVDLLELVDQLSGDEPEGSDRKGALSGRWRLWPLVLLVVVLVMVGLAWRYTPLSELADPNVAGASLKAARGSVWGPALVLAIYVIGGFVVLPVTILVVATAIAFGPWMGFVYAVAGAMLAAAATYGGGHLLGARQVERLTGRRIDWLKRQVREKGIIAMMAVRLIPVAPFSVVNFIAGASGVRFRDYIIGTTLGMVPGIAVITALGNQIEQLWRNPTVLNVAVLIGLLTLWFLLGLFLQRLLANRIGWRKDAVPN